MGEMFYFHSFYCLSILGFLLILLFSFFSFLLTVPFWSVDPVLMLDMQQQHPNPPSTTSLLSSDGDDTGKGDSSHHSGDGHEEALPYTFSTFFPPPPPGFRPAEEAPIRRASSSAAATCLARVVRLSSAPSDLEWTAVSSRKPIAADVTQLDLPALPPPTHSKARLKRYVSFV